MSQKDYTTKNRKFKHLTKEKRAQIEILLRRGVPKAEIAKEIGIARSTLYNELKRGTVEQMDSELKGYHAYFHDAGQRVYEEHRKNSRNSLKFAKAYAFLQYAEEQMLHQKLSPDAVCGRARLEEKFEESVCTKTLYNYIDQGLLMIKNIDLTLKTRRKTKRGRLRQERRQYGMNIDQRPEPANTRTEPGHWEIDTVIGRKDSGAVLLTLDERVTRKRHIVKIPSRTAAAVQEGMEKLAAIYGDQFRTVFKSITSDNGPEFARLSEALPGISVYYADPYSSYQRGTNEKQNSLVRRFFPKGRSFDDVPDEAIANVESWINNLPRKIFNYHTSDEIFKTVLFDLAI